MSKPRTLLSKSTSDTTDRTDRADTPRSLRPWNPTRLGSIRFSPTRTTIGDRKPTPRPVDTSTLQCYNYGKFGHIGKHCDQPAQKASIQEIEEEEDLFDDTTEESTDPTDRTDKDDLSGKEQT
jgi:hypothetical protein